MIDLKRAVLVGAALLLAATPLAAQEPDKPNILVIWGDDIGQSNISAYTLGLMGYRTPNIDRIADEGMIFTDYYGEQSLHRGPLVVHHGPERVPHRSVQGRPARRRARHARGGRRPSPRCSSAQGYATGQFGKNHLGDKDEHLPTNHGFDEFFGNLYHLNAEEEPENEDYPQGLRRSARSSARAA